MFGNNPTGAPWYNVTLAGLMLFVQLPLCGQTLMPPDSGEWTPADGAPAVTVEDGRQVFQCPFPAQTDRHYWDYTIQTNLAGADGMTISYTCEPPSAFRGITWYVRSPDGWFAAALPVADGRLRRMIPKNALERLDAPAGWEHVTGIRLSPWSAGRGGGRLILQSAAAYTADMAIVAPGADALPDFSERMYAQQAADWMGYQCTAMNLPYGVLTDTDLAGGDLQRFKLLVFPCHPHLAAPALRRIKQYIQDGGRLMVCYNNQPGLMALMGIRPGAYTAGYPGQYYAMGFIPDTRWTGPLKVLQGAPPNLLTATPASPDARELAWWFDLDGRRQAEAAVLSTPTGFWFSHVLSNDDETMQRRMLAALWETVLPGTFARAAHATLEMAENRAGRPFGAFTAMVEDGPALRELRKQAQSALDNGAAARAWDISDRLAREMDRQAAKLWDIKNTPRTIRGIWIDAALPVGAPARLADELADAGFTDALIAVPHGATSPPALFSACAQRGMRAHAWHICWNRDGAPASELAQWKSAGRLQQSAAGDAAHWLCPAREENRAMEMQRIMTLADWPDVSGIHLDYIRYPGLEYCYCPNCRKAFETAMDIRATAWPADARAGKLTERFSEWRARQISSFVADVSRRLRQTHPAVKISAAVFPTYPECIGREGQDWGGWLRDNLLDFVCPMNYTGNTGEFTAWTAAQTGLPGAAMRIVAGIGTASDHSRLSPARTACQAQAAERAGAIGYAIFKLNHTLWRELLPAWRAPMPDAPRDK